MDPHRPKLVVGISSEGQSHNQLLVTAGKLNFRHSPQLNLVNYKSARSSVKIKTKTENGRLYRANPRGLECCAEYYYHRGYITDYSSLVPTIVLSESGNGGDRNVSLYIVY